MAYFDKAQEREDLDLFLSARKDATGEELEYSADSEAPDFLCRRPDGEVVGVEHTRIEYNPERMEDLEACGLVHGELDNPTVFWAAFTALAKKELKRRRPHWKFPQTTILVMDLPAGFRVEDWPQDASLSEDFADSGFIEVWICDHSSIEAYGEATVIGLYPRNIWGIQGQGYLCGVPYK